MTDLNKALADIADIRDQIESARLFRGFGPWVIALSGLLAFAVTALQLVQPERYAGDSLYMLTVWVGMALFALALILMEMWALSRRHHGSMAFPMARRVAEGFLPALMIGAIIGGVVLVRAPDTVWILPSVWQFMIAAGLFASMGSMHKNIYWVAIWYFLCGSVSLIALSGGTPLSPLFMGIPFGVGQILMGLVLAFSFRKKPGALS